MSEEKRGEDVAYRAASRAGPQPFLYSCSPWCCRSANTHSLRDREGTRSRGREEEEEGRRTWVRLPLQEVKGMTAEKEWSKSCCQLIVCCQTLWRSNYKCLCLTSSSPSSSSSSPSYEVACNPASSPLTPARSFPHFHTHFTSTLFSPLSPCLLILLLLMKQIDLRPPGGELCRCNRWFVQLYQTERISSEQHWMKNVEKYSQTRKQVLTKFPSSFGLWDHKNSAPTLHPLEDTIFIWKKKNQFLQLISSRTKEPSSQQRNSGQQKHHNDLKQCTKLTHLFDLKDSQVYSEYCKDHWCIILLKTDQNNKPYPLLYCVWRA